MWYQLSRSLSSTRRGSMWGGGSAAALPSSSQPVKDTRPLRERQYQAQIRQEILKFLQESGYDISMSTLTNIQGKDYRSIICHLTYYLDPAHPINQGGRFEDEFVPVLKSLRYPFAHQVDSKWLAAPASMHCWPALLGVLHWLVEFCRVCATRAVKMSDMNRKQMREQCMNSGDPSLQELPVALEDFADFDDQNALAFEYYKQSYSIWLDGADELTESNEWLEERYGEFRA